MSISSRMAGFGHYVPDRRVANEELEQHLGLDTGWIERRTGIRERRWAAPDETLTDMAMKAGEMALQDAGVPHNSVALVILATSTPDHLLPPSAPLLAHKLGLENCGGIDLAGACSGFLYALVLADGFVKNFRKPVLVVAANILSRRVSMEERNTAILFADAAGSVLLAPSNDPHAGLRGSALMSDGGNYGLISIPAGETRMTMRDGKAVFTQAVRMMLRCATDALEQAKLTASDVNRFFPHQANARIIDTVCDQLHLPASIAARSIGVFGNSSAATIPLSLSLASKSQPFQSGERLLLSAAGAGMLAGAAVWEIGDG
ncbi:beta-ketoacyl-ACP synthase III [Brucella sp. ZJ1_1]|uniref:3-oxopimeloyl-[acyl-carrier-protein] synthase n=3 Tax=Brucella TaxID=234 RepID=C4WL66_9HYPH|nr:beta-ketoacyl-ACP synthase III [Brucella intermedia]EEQ92963.1 3-oxoacyl-(acyl carrier protein) synthase II [Brucella intermedia LMG 3301]NKB95957.1 beta-ketoacyl-ACP synthase III [Brucella intermedia]NKC28653.1 beta-ketoacyl-ACP synthase III [Brucella ciceri]SUA87666.1 3-oxoacyl-[acyl-carrier-protein] synthase 3 [Brucella intermedia]